MDTFALSSPLPSSLSFHYCAPLSPISLSICASAIAVMVMVSPIFSCLTHRLTSVRRLREACVHCEGTTDEVFGAPLH